MYFVFHFLFAIFPFNAPTARRTFDEDPEGSLNFALRSMEAGMDLDKQVGVGFKKNVWSMSEVTVSMVIFMKMITPLSGARNTNSFIFLIPGYATLK